MLSEVANFFFEVSNAYSAYWREPIGFLLNNTEPNRIGADFVFLWVSSFMSYQFFLWLNFGWGHPTDKILSSWERVRLVAYGIVCFSVMPIVMFFGLFARSHRISEEAGALLSSWLVFLLLLSSAVYAVG